VTTTVLGSNGGRPERQDACILAFVGVEDLLHEIFDRAIEKAIASVGRERLEQVLAERPNLFEDTMPSVVVENHLRSGGGA
jgi:hypothetical protein